MVKKQYFGFLRKVKLRCKFRAEFIINFDEIPTYFYFLFEENFIPSENRDMLRGQ